MDDLLHRLRHDMVELSSQGDHFTHQIWLMYGQFEQVVDRFSEDEDSPAEPIQTSVLDDMNSTKMDRFEMSDHYSSDSESSCEGDAHLPVPHQRCRTAGRMNPLLETISVIEFDSDDAVDGVGTRGLYTGSVDSGYKSPSSCCPTPDQPAQHGQGGELDLDHLTSLRQTLLTAIERYDSRTKELLRPRSSTPPPPLPPPAQYSHNRSFRLTKPAASDRVHQLQEQDDGRTNNNNKGDETSSSQPTSAPDGATRFSRVARCMLEIIEDLQRQQQNQQQQHQPTNPPAAPPARCPVVPPKPIRSSKLLNKVTSAVAAAPANPPAPATPPRVARRGRRKMPTPQPPPEEEPAADYHLYEEILYDLSGRSGPTFPTHPKEPIPPPLPARPCLKTKNDSSSSWMLKNVISKPLRRDRNNQLIRSNWNPALKDADGRPNGARSNVYTFGSHHQPTSPVIRHHQHEDEYGFRAAMV